jgi:hypothetical protein
MGQKVMSKSSEKTDDVKKAGKDKDRSIGERAPGTPFVMVALTYIGILAIVCLALAALIWLGR